MKNCPFDSYLSDSLAQRTLCVVESFCVQVPDDDGSTRRAHPLFPTYFSRPLSRRIVKLPKGRGKEEKEEESDSLCSWTYLHPQVI